MAIKKNGGLPPRLEGVRRRFERWRRGRKVGSRIPGPLWDAAVRMAGEYGVNRSAKALRVDYYSLKERAEQKAAEAKCANTGDAAATFFELAPLELNRSELSNGLHGGLCECTLELEDAGGARMRVYLKGSSVPDLAALSREFWRGEP